ncbi:hypothetical protein LTR53_006703 [Teratosphaeriaceae sp. CCFEE 6253]|nr:hypothetical protein LTR53_006703 [Teratosphaeriaceae sp. CCFEE 6253]
MQLSIFALAAACIPFTTAAPSLLSGCGKAHAAGFHDSQSATATLVSNNKTRRYAVQVPKNYKPAHPYPVIFDFHSASDTPRDQRDNSAYFNYTNDYLVVYPRGLGLSWQGPAYATEGVDDLLFTTDLLAHIRGAYCVDPARVYASGKSNGGGFVDTLACSDAGDAFAAFAMASPALYTDLNITACHGKKRAILEVHGNKDTTTPYHPTAHVRGGAVPDIGKWVSWWGQRDCGTGAKAVVDTKNAKYNVTSYSCEGRSGVVQHYRLADGGHCWPSPKGLNFDGRGGHCKGARSLDFTAKVLGFVGNFTLQNAPVSGLSASYGPPS